MIENDKDENKPNHSIHKKCPNCGNRTISTKGVVSRTVECDTCGSEFDTSEVHRSMFFGEDSIFGSDSETSGQDVLEQAKETSGQKIREWEEQSEKRRQERENIDIDELSEKEIAKRIKRIKQQGGATAGSSYAASIGLIATGTILSITIIGAVIGIPMILAGISGLVGTPIKSLFNIGENKMKGSPWDGTGLKGHEMREHRKVNEKFEYRCPHCGQFASLRKAPNKVDLTAQCDGCGVMYEREVGYGRGREKPYWRMIKGDSDLIGEINKPKEWQSIRKERRIKSK